MSDNSFHVRVTKDTLVFSAAHFITFTPQGEPNRIICERLHGHNWRAEVEVAGPLDSNEYVFDFIALRDAAQAIVNRLDHRLLLPTKHPLIRVSQTPSEVQVTFADRRWIVPADEAVLMPIANTTAERIAEWFGLELIQQLGKPLAEMQTLSVSIEENFGQWATCTLPVAGVKRVPKPEPL